MDDKKIFALGLGIAKPWYIDRIELIGEDLEKELHIYLDHPKGARFEYDDKQYPVYDHQERNWHHLRFFQHQCFLHARVPRIKTDDGKVKLVEVPWAQPGSSFTLLFERDVLNLIQEGMSVSGVSRRLSIGDKRVSRIIMRHVSQALATQEIEVVKELAVDETSTRKGHNYFTIMSDREAKKVIGVAVGKDKEAFAHALIDMEIRGGNRAKVRSITMDMSTAYISAAGETMAQADIVFDRFHIIKKLNEAVDKIRRTEQKVHAELRKTRYLWLKNNSNLTEEQRHNVDYLETAFPKIGVAYRLKELLRAVLDEAHNSHYLKPLNNWMKQAWDSGLEPIMNFVNMLKRHWYGIKTYFKKVATNAFAERVNLKIQEIKRIAKGYGNPHNFMMMIYFHLGDLKLVTHSK
jgi:transposase